MAEIDRYTAARRAVATLSLCLWSAISSSAPVSTSATAATLASFEKPGEPGCVVGVLQRGKWAFKGAYGLADLPSGKRNSPDLIFGVASVTKQFTAAAVAIAAHQGYFELRDDIRKYLPEMPDYGTPITIAELVYHTDGIRDHGRIVPLTGQPQRYDSQASRVALLARQRALNFEPGTQYMYGNAGYLLLAEIIERTTRQPFPAFVEKNIFRPLGMKHSYFGSQTRGTAGRAMPYSRRSGTWRNTDGEAPATWGSAGVMTTLDDYAKWASNLFAERSKLPGGTQLTKLLQRHGTLHDGTPVDYGFGLRLHSYRGVRQVGHSGAGDGYQALAMMFPDRQLGVFGFCNNGVYAHEVVMAVTDPYLGLPPPGTTSSGERVQLPPEQLQRLAGAYREPQFRLPMFVQADSDALIIDGDAKRYRYLPLGDTRFRNEENIIIDFGGPADAPAQTLNQLEGRKYGSGVFSRIQTAAPTVAQLNGFAGDYYSADLDATYQFSVRDGQLTAHIVNGRSFPNGIGFQPVLADEFVAIDERMVVRFTHDAGGGIDGLDLTHQFGWIKDVRFERRD